MNPLEQIFPAAVAAKSATAKGAKADSAPDKDPALIFALEPFVTPEAAGGEPEAVPELAAQPADAPAQTPQTPKPPFAIPEELLLETGSRAEQAPGAPASPGLEAEIAPSDPGIEAKPAPVMMAAATPPPVPEIEGKPDMPVAADGKTPPKAGLLAKRSSGQPKVTDMPAPADPKASSVSDETASQTAQQAQKVPPGKPVLEGSARPGQVPEFAPAADAAPKAWGLRTEFRADKPGKTQPIVEVKDGAAKTAAAELPPAPPRAEIPNPKAPLPRPFSIPAGTDFTFQLAGMDERPGGGTGSAEPAMTVPAAKPVQMPAAMPTAAAGARVPSLPIQNIAVEIAHRFQAGDNKFRIKLDPPELGRIDVRMTVSREGHVTAHMAVDKPETLAALQRDAGALERALGTSGLDTDKNSLNFSLRQGNQGFDRSGDGSEFQPGSPTGSGASDEGDEPAPELVLRGYANPDGIDLHV